MLSLQILCLLVSAVLGNILVRPDKRGASYFMEISGKLDTVEELQELIDGASIQGLSFWDASRSDLDNLPEGLFQESVISKQQINEIRARVNILDRRSEEDKNKDPWWIKVALDRLCPPQQNFFLESKPSPLHLKPEPPPLGGTGVFKPPAPFQPPTNDQGMETSRLVATIASPSFSPFTAPSIVNDWHDSPSPFFPEIWDGTSPFFIETPHNEIESPKETPKSRYYQRLDQEMESYDSKVVSLLQKSTAMEIPPETESQDSDDR